MKHTTDNPAIYEFRVSGRLDPHWAAQFPALALTPNGDGTTSLRVEIVDQAALHGVLARMRDTGLSIVAVVQSDH